MSSKLSDSLKRAKFIFDLNGYCVVKGVLSQKEIIEARKVIDNHRQDFKERQGPSQRNSVGAKQDRLSGDGNTGRFDLGGILDWTDSDIFRSFMCHEKLIPYLNLILGKGYRLDHEPFIIRQIKGSEGFNLHGGPCRELQYSMVNGEITTNLLGVSFFINDQKKTDGGFCVVKGSHKTNFPMPESFKNGEDDEFFKHHVLPVEVDAGDVVLFSEATVHGSFAWNIEKERLLALYRFSTATNANARGYLLSPDRSHWTAEQKSVIQPPFDARFDRQVLSETGLKTNERSQIRKDFDEEVFGKKYY